MDKKPGRSRPGAARSKTGAGADPTARHDPPRAEVPRDDRTADRAKAAALSYKPADRDAAPVVVASGADALAERIIAAAEEAGVPIRRDADLVEILAATEIGEEIPIEAFIAVAEILGYIYRQNRKTPPAPPPGPDGEGPGA